MDQQVGTVEPGMETAVYLPPRHVIPANPAATCVALAPSSASPAARSPESRPFPTLLLSLVPIPRHQPAAACRRRARVSPNPHLPPSRALVFGCSPPASAWLYIKLRTGMGLEMAGAAAEEAAYVAAAARARMEQPGVEIYPLSRYYFGAKDARSRSGETAADRALRLKANFAEHGLRTSVHGVLLVELSDHPHLLLLQVRNSSFLLPGGRLRPGEQDVQGLKRKLSSTLSAGDHPATENEDDGWQIGECVGMWWISEFDAAPFPYLLPKSPAPKECIKLFLIRLPMSRQFVVPRNFKMLAVPLSRIHDNSQVYGPVISGIPNLLSKFSFSTVQD